MKLIKLSAVVLFLALLLLPTVFNRVAHGASGAASTGTTSTTSTTTSTTTTTTDSPSTAQETPLTEQQSAALSATTDEANKVSGSDSNAANDPVDPEGVAAGTTGTFSYTDADPADAGSTTTANSTTAATASADTASTDVALTCPPAPAPTKAPADYDNKTNGLIPQGTPVPPNTDPKPGTFEADKFIFSQVDEITPDGLGPVYNAQSCRECHQNPVTGSISQINELRAGHNLFCDSNNACGPNPCPPPH